jgi:hypothetical protein
MSWSVLAIGKAPAVAAEIERQFAQSKCSEPEESVRQSARLTLASALAAQEPSTMVEVSAAGSQSTKYKSGTNEVLGVTNGLSIKIDPKFGFVE